MSNEPVDQKNSDIQGFWFIVRDLFKKRDEILSSSNRMVDYSKELPNCDREESSRLFAEVRKEMNTIISCLHLLRPHLKNKNIVEGVSEAAKTLHFRLSVLESLSGALPKGPMYGVATAIGLLAQAANRTSIELTRKSVKRAFGIDVGIEGAKIKAYIEQDTSNY